MFVRFFEKSSPVQQDAAPYEHLIDLRKVVKTYKTEAGDFIALKGIDLTIDRGEFVGIVGKSGSGKSTLVNMLTGIDRPSSGEIHIAGTGIHALNEGQMAQWRGRNQGVVFQFFQLLPTLTLIENVMLPMDFCNLYTPRERRERAMELLALVDIAEQANKLPSAISGGQQQRAAIARSLANDPPMIIADEPTGNLDSRTAEQVFLLFERMVKAGKTLLMVTHDDDLASRVTRTIVIADGEIVNEWLAKALPTLSQQMMVKITRLLEPQSFAPGQPIIAQGDQPDFFYIIKSGEAHVYLVQPNGHEIFVESLSREQFFGETAFIEGGVRTATIRASRETPVEVFRLDAETFRGILTESAETHEVLTEISKQRLKALKAIK
jgi:ABC-type lipoprotein export system ATPase subunit